MSLIEAKAVWKRTDCSVTLLMFSYLLVVEQHRTQIVIHALLKCQQENLYHEQNVTHIDRKSGSAGMPRPISYAVFCLKKKKSKKRWTNGEKAKQNRIETKRKNTGRV